MKLGQAKNLKEYEARDFYNILVNEKKSNLQNDARISTCIDRFDNECIQDCSFSSHISHSLGVYSDRGI